MNPAIQTAFDSWTPPVATIAMLLLTAAIYARGFARLHRQMPDRFPIWRLAMFMGGIAALFIAIASPLEALDDLLLQIHMTQHLLLMIVAPPLLLAGAPAIAICARSSSDVSPRQSSARFSARAVVRRLFAWLTEPLVCWIAFVVATWGWHLPATFQLALRSDGWHVVEHACFFTTALMFWYPVVQPWPSVARWPRWAMLPYLLLADGQNTILAALFMFSDRLIYPVLCDHAAHRGLHSPWRPGCRRRYHVGARFDFLSRARSAHHVSDARAAKRSAPLFPSPEGRGVRGEVSRAIQDSASAR